VAFEIQAHRGNDEHSLRRLVAAGPSTVEIDVGISAGGLPVAAHEPDLSDSTGLTVGDAIALAGAVPLIVEAKCVTPLTPGPRSFVQALTPFLRQIALCSFEEGVLAEARRSYAGIATTFLFEKPLCIATAASTLGPQHALVTQDLVHAAHTLGLRVVPWTVNDPRRMIELIDLNVDGLVTDEPALARDVVTRRIGVAA
jgi:glycerophosphoryl diester phosphodiesterase